MERRGHERAITSSRRQPPQVSVSGDTPDTAFAGSRTHYAGSVGDYAACVGNDRSIDTVGTAGRLVFDIFNPSIHHLAQPADGTETDEEPPFTLPDGRTVVRRHRMVERNLISQVNSGEIVYYITHRDGRQERQIHGHGSLREDTEDQIQQTADKQLPHRKRHRFEP